MADQSSQGIAGQQGLTDATHQFNVNSFHISQEQGWVRTSVPVKIIAVHGGGVGAPPTVDVQPVVNMMDGAGNATQHGTIYGISCTRNQGGGNAIINDPQVGDIGHMVICDRDISSVKANAGDQSNPGSFRRHDLADGIYTAFMMKATTPTQYHQFTGSGINHISPQQILQQVAGSVTHQMNVSNILHTIGAVTHQLTPQDIVKKATKMLFNCGI